MNDILRLITPPAICEKREKTIRELRDGWDSHADFTGDRRALAVVECLTYVLIESGCRP